MSDDITVTTLQIKMEALTSSISALTRSVEANNEKLERLALLEVAHNNSNDAIKRAFEAIEAIRAEAKVDRKENSTEHYTYNKWMWIAIGFTSAVSVAWSVVGYRINAMLDDQSKTVVEMKNHLLLNPRGQVLTAPPASQQSMQGNSGMYGTEGVR
jgi:hypothetical protein